MNNIRNKFNENNSIHAALSFEIIKDQKKSNANYQYSEETFSLFSTLSPKNKKNYLDHIVSKTNSFQIPNPYKVIKNNDINKNNHMNPFESLTKKINQNKCGPSYFNEAVNKFETSMNTPKKINIVIKGAKIAKDNYNLSNISKVLYQNNQF